MGEEKQQLATRNPQPSFEQLQTMATAIAGSRMFGVENEDQALALMLLCQAEGLHPVMALRRYHIIDGKPAMRADALQGEFERVGAILWHERNEQECSATFFRDKDAVDHKAIERAKLRYLGLKAQQSVAEFGQIGELTIIRTFDDAVAKRVACRWDKEGKQWVLKHSWKQSPRQMLHARCLTEGVRAIDPGLIAGVYTEDEIIDVPATEDLDQRPREEIIERNVRQATANAVAEGEGTPEQLAEWDKVTKPPETPYGPKAVTEDNWREVVSHVGQAQGNLLGRKVGELHQNVIEWLYKKWREKLGPSASEQDFRLKAAIEFAYKDSQQKQQGGDKNGSGSGSERADTSGKESRAATSATASATSATASATSASASARKSDTAVRTGGAATAAPLPPNKVELANKLIERASDLILTPAQFSDALLRHGVLSEGQMLPDLTVETLQYLLSDEGWNTFKAAHEKEVKPKVLPPKPPQKRRKRTRR